MHIHPPPAVGSQAAFLRSLPTSSSPPLVQVSSEEHRVCIMSHNGGPPRSLNNWPVLYTFFRNTCMREDGKGGMDSRSSSRAHMNSRGAREAGTVNVPSNQQWANQGQIRVLSSETAILAVNANVFIPLGGLTEYEWYSPPLLTWLHL